MVSPLDGQTDAGQVANHVVAKIGEMVYRGYWEVATLVLHLVTAVAAAIGVRLSTAVPSTGFGIDVVEAGVGPGLETRRIEDVELGLWAHERGIADAGRSQVVLSLARNVARVAAVGLLGQRVMNEEVQRKGLRLAERVEEGARGVRHQRHVGLVDLLEATDRGPVEGQTVLEHVGIEEGGGHSEVLHHTGKVAEPDVDSLDTLVLDEGQQVVGALEHVSSKVWVGN